METLRIVTELENASEIIKNGGLVAVPTETVYGLACSGLNETAVEKIYEVKGRPPVKPLSLMVRGAEDIDSFCFDVPEAARSLAEKYWPGPLTIVLKAKPIVPEIVRAGGSSVGLRCPDHALTQELLHLCALPLAAPSANPSGEASPKDAETVLAYFDGQIDAVIDGGSCGIGTESTLIDMSSVPYRVLREAALSREELEKALAEAMCIIGITGGSGCGKTTALNALKERGALIIDCDALYHEMLANDEALLEDLGASFPSAMINGSIDRKVLGGIVFKDEAELMKLNAITHGHISRAVNDLLEAHAMNGGTLAAIDAVELISSGISRLCDAVIGVRADRGVRIRRIMLRDSISEEAAGLRLDAQKDDRYYEQNCGYIVTNNGDIPEFLNDFNDILEEVINNG